MYKLINLLAIKVMIDWLHIYADIGMYICVKILSYGFYFY